MVRITRKPISLEALIGRVHRERDGAVVTFLGTVRSPSDGRKVLRIEYEAYTEMASTRLAQIANEIAAKWQIKDVAIVHRVGPVKAGEAAVAIVIAAPHRKEAFTACSYAIDRIKEIVPLWKKEVYPTGAKWVKESP
ncbi:MAG: molybdenum cofactor biosynthesis protein MoaE [Chloroflexota bacterium]